MFHHMKMASALAVQCPQRPWGGAAWVHVIPHWKASCPHCTVLAFREVAPARVLLSGCVQPAGWWPLRDYLLSFMNLADFSTEYIIIVTSPPYQP